MDIAKYAGQKIKYFREQKRWTQTDLAKKVGIGKTAVANYESGLRSPKQDILFDLAKVFDISINEFFPETVVKENNIASIYFKLKPPRQQNVYNYAKDQLEQQNHPNVYSIEEAKEEHTVDVAGVVSAGTGEWLDGQQSESVTVEGPLPHYDFAVRVNGVSMTPTFSDGEILFVDKVESASDVRNNQFVIAEINGNAYVKKLFVSNEDVRLISLNKDYEDIIIHDYDDYRIIGIVVI
mgnify:CR=1 FL=1